MKFSGWLFVCRKLKSVFIGSFIWKLPVTHSKPFFSYYESRCVLAAQHSSIYISEVEYDDECGAARSGLFVCNFPIIPSYNTNAIAEKGHWGSVQFSIYAHKHMACWYIVLWEIYIYWFWIYIKKNKKKKLKSFSYHHRPLRRNITAHNNSIQVHSQEFESMKSKWFLQSGFM